MFVAHIYVTATHECHLPNYNKDIPTGNFRGPHRVLGALVYDYRSPASAVRIGHECAGDLWKLLQELQVQGEAHAEWEQNCDHGGLFLQNIQHPPDCIHCIAARQMCRRSRFLPVSVLYWLLLENLFALPRRGEGASPPFWLLLSATALSQHSVSSSQSPCQQDFTQWPGELQSVAQPHTLPLPLSHIHTHRTSTHTQTNTLQLSSPPPPPPTLSWQAGQQTPFGYNVWKVTQGLQSERGAHCNREAVNKWSTTSIASLK